MSSFTHQTINESKNKNPFSQITNIAKKTGIKLKFSKKEKTYKTTVPKNQ
jgi:hypothetical protein